MENIHKELLPLLEQAIEEQKELFIEGISEYQLIQILKDEPYKLLNVDSLSDALLLFQTHFVIFHVLYRLREKWRTAKQGELDILTTCIKFTALSLCNENISDENIPRDAVATADPLSNYYSDWGNFNKTDANDVSKMLDSFWEQMAGIAPRQEIEQTQINDALRCLDFSRIEDLDIQTLKLHYRKQQHVNHPDKGGSIQKSQQIVQSYSLLKRYLENIEKS